MEKLKECSHIKMCSINDNCNVDDESWRGKARELYRKSD
jgi:hypothetical protein